MGESNHTRGSRTEVFAVPSRGPTGLPLTVSLPCVSFLDKKHLIFTALPELIRLQDPVFLPSLLLLQDAHGFAYGM